MSRERALLRRLDKAEADLRAVGGYENELQYIPAGGVRSLLADLRALLAEPKGGTPESNMLWEARNWAGRKPTPRSRAEGSDLSVDQGREFRVVDGLGDNNRAGKVTIDPTLLSPATPRSRAEAEAMLKLYDVRVETNRRYADEYSEKEMIAQRAALLAALIGGGG